MLSSILRPISEHMKLVRRTVKSPTDETAAAAIAGDSLVGLFNKLAALPAKNGTLAVQLLGAGHGTGVSTIARCLAEFAAINLGAPVLLVDANPGLPDQANDFALQPAVSLEIAYREGIEFGNAITAAKIPHLSYARLSDIASLESLDSAWTIPFPAIEAILAHLRAHFHWIVFDSAPPASLAFSYVLSRFMDGTVLVVEAEKTRVPVGRELVRQIRANGGNPIGVVINKRRFIIPNYIYRYL